MSRKGLGSSDEMRVKVKFVNGSVFSGLLCLNPHSGKLVFDNDSGQGTVNEDLIEGIEFNTGED